jgi:hypothetical protein
MNRLLKWVRGGTAAERLAAWSIGLGAAQAPIASSLAAMPGAGDRVDNAAHRLFARLYLDAASKRRDANNGGAFVADPTADPMWTPLLIAELKANLMNVDGVRSYATRRDTVAILKKLQSNDALQALHDARSAVAAAAASATGADAAPAAELLARVDAATQSYFNP